jgi:hypothetical protein
VPPSQRRGREVGASRTHACAAATGSLARWLPPWGHVTQTPAARSSRRLSFLRHRRTTVEASPCAEGGRSASALTACVSVSDSSDGCVQRTLVGSCTRVFWKVFIVTPLRSSASCRGSPSPKRRHTRAGLRLASLLLVISASRLSWDDAHAPLQACKLLQCTCTCRTCRSQQRPPLLTEE